MKITVSFFPWDWQNADEQVYHACSSVESVKEAVALIEGALTVLESVSGESMNTPLLKVGVCLLLKTDTCTWSTEGTPEDVLRRLTSQVHLLSREKAARRKQAKELNDN
jgi:hypothetical protein